MRRAQRACQLKIRGALPFRPFAQFTPTKKDSFYSELGFAAGNGLNPVSPFQLQPWVAELEDDFQNINGRNRDHLLTAWYRREIVTGAADLLGVTIGLIDSTDYLDNNAFANNEYIQFMNEAFVNSPQIFLPAYDLGTAFQWDRGLWFVSAVYMNAGKEEDKDTSPDAPSNRDIGDDYNFAGVQLGRAITSALGNGTYRFVYTRTSRDFLDPTGTSIERRQAVAFSFDQEFGKGVGAFLRLDFQSDKAAVVHQNQLATGIDLGGSLWGRRFDNIGVGIAYLNGGNLDIESTRVAEAYYRFMIARRFGLTLDLQYMHDQKRTGNSPRGYILGLRGDIIF